MRLLLPLTVACSTLALGENWPQWRGPYLDGTSGEKNLPVVWSKTENISWRLPMPSRSGSTPIIWGDRIFLNVADGGNVELWCLHREKGDLLWKRPTSGGQLQDQQAEHVVPLAGYRWPDCLRPHRHRRTQSLRL